MQLLCHKSFIIATGQPLKEFEKIEFIEIMDVTGNYYYLGKITKLHSYEGKLVLYLDTDEPQRYSELKSVFVLENGGLVPYFFEEFKLNGNKAVVRFADVDKEKAVKMVNHELYLPLDMLPPLSGDKFYYFEIKGFEVIDDKFGKVGTINDVLEYPNQAVIQVFRDKKEVLIPVSDDIIKKLDRKNRRLYVTLPDGLLSVYL